MTAQENRLRARLRDQQRAIVRTALPLERLLMRSGQIEGAEAPTHDEQEWTPAVTGTAWGGQVAWAWFRAWFRVRSSWTNQQVRLSLPLGGQGLVYLDGQAWQGMDENHRTVTLPAACLDGASHLAAVEAYASPSTTIARRPDNSFSLGECRLEVVDSEAEALYYDFAVGLEALAVLPEAAVERAALLTLLLEAENMVDRTEPGTDAFRRSVALARAHLARALQSLAAGSAAQRPLINAVGHAHIDTAWLWPLAQTRRKVARSWSTVLRLMERYPDLRFLGSQPRQYRWLEEDEPELYRQVAERVEQGRWELGGAMWVEADTNLPSGESLVRQFLYGQRFLRERFGQTCSYLWLPDAFGFSAALPQLMRGAGLHSLVTIKLSWNATNRMPHDTFRWRGIDGTEVLGYFMTAGSDWTPGDYMSDPYPVKRGAANYNGTFSLKETVGSWVRYRDKDLNTETLYSFGFGDGGGGPTEQMLEYAARLRDYPGLPRVSQRPVSQQLKALSDRVLRNPTAPVWEGELYLEYHRGTYTSQARAKWDNRRAKHLLHDAEIWCAWAGALGHQRDNWQERLTACWEDVLLNQFHDILPGSSIAEVYEDQRRQLATVLATAGGVLAEAQDCIARQIQAAEPGIALFNSSPFTRADTVELRLPAGHAADTALLDQEGRRLSAQPLPGGTILVGGAVVPPLGYTVIVPRHSEDPMPDSDLTASERLLENRYFRLALDERGRFTSLYDKRHDREVLAPGGANRLLAFEDRPVSYDAWDIDEYYVDKVREIDDVQSWQVVETGPVRAGVEICRRFGSSTIRQRIVLHAHTPRLDIQTTLDWHHRQILLKAAFPLSVHATQATYECAFGYLQRPTHRNTTWDAARFEVAAHRWADLSEVGYGCSLLNDGKYGHDCLGNVLSLTLLKSAVEPDPLADEGMHSFTYSLFPHGSDWRIEDTVAAAMALNAPMRARQVPAGEGQLLAEASLVQSSAGHVVVDTVKPAENGQGLIVRLYDCANQRGPVRLTFARPIETAAAVTILEEPDPLAPAPRVDGQHLDLSVLPFQIRSFRVTLR